ncbi:MAG: RNA ligase [Haloferacaceae archaeon]
MGYADALGVSEADVEAILDRTERCTYGDREFRVLPNASRGVERGTVFVDGTVVRGYPSVPRALVLEAGVRSVFDGEFAVEEKLNGYNARVARVGEVLAFTRSGYVCPFTTDLVADSLPVAEFFDDHPELLLAGEVYGPENPYTVHDYPGVEHAAFRVFDVRDRTSGDPLPVRERRQLCAAYDLPQVPSYGWFDPDAGPAVRAVVDELDERGREGIVMKSADGTDLLKYTTGTANRDDLRYAFSLPFDYGRDFAFSRIVREGFQAVERGEDRERARERAHRLGEALLLPMIDAIRAVRAGETVGERHTIRGDPMVIRETLGWLRNQGLALEIEADRTEDGERVVEFVKVAASTRDTTEHYLDGGTVDR